MISKKKATVLVKIYTRKGTIRHLENPSRWEAEYHWVTVGKMSFQEYLAFQEKELKTNFLNTQKVAFEECL